MLYVSGSKYHICFILYVIILFGFVSFEAHAQTVDELLVRWTIQGQSDVAEDVSSEDISKDNIIVVIEETHLEQVPSSQEAQTTIDSDFKYDSFVTGNQYGIGDYKISIFSEEGQILNQVIIDQQATQSDNFRHKIKYYDRFSDGYIEIAESLLDPLGKQTYFIDGSVYDYNKNSNLELFVLERGYSLDNLYAIPNEIFSPMEFTLGRALLADATSAGKGAGDLRVYSSNHRVFDDLELKSKIEDSLSKQNMDVINELFAPSGQFLVAEPNLYTLTPPLPEPLSVSTDPLVETKPQPDIIDDLFDDIEFMPSKFEDAGRVRMAVEMYNYEKPQVQPPSTLAYVTLFQNINSVHDVVTVALLSVTIGLVFFGYIMWRNAKQRHTVVDTQLLTTSVVSIQPSNYNKNVIHEMLSNAQSNYTKGYYKEAYEMLGQAIRLFYSHRFNLQQQGQLTNEELLRHMQQHVPSDSKEYLSVKTWLIVCGSVEYAKYAPDFDAFVDVLDSFSDVIN